MATSNNVFLTVCASALMIFAVSPAMAQDSAQAMESQMKSDDLSDALPVPTDAESAPAVLTDADVTPTPILSTGSPDTPAVSSATKVGSYNPRSTDRIVTLRDAVAVGVLTNPETETVENNRRATDEELEQAKALYLPSIDLQADTGYDSIYSKPKGQVKGHSDLWRSQASLTLTQMLFDGFDAHYENERQHHRVRSASHRVRETAEFVGLDIVESYLDILRQRELLQIAEENVRQHQSIMQQIEDSATAGRSTQADVEQTKARVQAAVAQVVAVRQALENAEASYRRRVGDVAQPDLQRPVSPVSLLESGVDDEVKQVLTHSPTLDIKEADVNVAEAEWKQTKSTLYPQVDLQVGTSIGENVSGVEGRTQETNAMIVTNWNLYRGGGDEARVREYVYRHAQAKTDRNATARSVESDVRQTWANMMAARKRGEAFRKQADANAMVVQAYKDQFNLDRRTLLDVLDAQNEWFVSRSNAINNEYLDMFAVYRLLALQGNLLPSLGVAYPKEAKPSDTSRKS